VKTIRCIGRAVKTIEIWFGGERTIEMYWWWSKNNRNVAVDE